MSTIMTNKEILDEAIAKIIERGDEPNYPMHKHLADAELIADLSELKMKYKYREALYASIQT